MSCSTQKPSVFAYLVAFGGLSIGLIGAAMVLAATWIPATQQVPHFLELGQRLQSLGPLLGAPGLFRSGLTNQQPSWMLFAVASFLFWGIGLLNPAAQTQLAWGVFILTVSFLFAGLSNVEHPDQPKLPLLEGLKNPLRLLAFMGKDVALMVSVGLKNTLSLVLLPFTALQNVLAGNNVLLPEALQPQNAWQGRRFGGFYFALAGLCAMIAALVPPLHDLFTMLFDKVGLIGGILVNYSLFFTGFTSPLWMDKVLMLSTVIATIGSGNRSQVWGVSMDQFGSRINELYFSSLQFRETAAATAAHALENAEVQPA